MKKIDVLAAVLVAIGGLNWGLIGLFNFNLVEYLFAKTYIDKIIYIIVGFAAFYQAVCWKKINTRWCGKK